MTFARRQTAVRTGGIYCPLMQTCPAADYLPSGQLDPSKRIVGATQRCSVVNKSKSEQAAECVIKTIGNSPYVLVSEKDRP